LRRRRRASKPPQIELSGIPYKLYRI